MVGVPGKKLYQRVSSRGILLFYPSDTCFSMYCFATKHWKNEWKKMRTWVS